MAFAAPPITSRTSIRDFIQTLDPVADHQQICFLSTCYDFPWDYTRALEFALFRTFGVAKGTPLLERTGEFVERTRKRYDDTVLILGELLAPVRRRFGRHDHGGVPVEDRQRAVDPGEPPEAVLKRRVVPAHRALQWSRRRPQERSARE